MAHALDIVADLVADEVTHVSLHDGSPGDNGANEVSGGDPAYGRKVPTYAEADGGEADLDAALEFDGPANGDVSHYGLWQGGTFLFGAPTSGGGFNSDGRFDLTSAPIKITFA